MHAVASSGGLSADGGRDLVKCIMESFDQIVFRNMIESLDDCPDSAALGRMFEGWNAIESREATRAIRGRMETLEKLGGCMDANSGEVPAIHECFKKAPWILEPAWTRWQDEAGFSKMLRESYPDGDLDESDRRIGILAIGAGYTIHVVDLKRPGHKIQSRDMDRLIEYVEFVKEKIVDDPKRSRRSVAGYMVAGSAGDGRVMRRRIGHGENDRLYTRTYKDTIGAARQIHRDLGEKPKEFKTPSARIP